MENSKKIVVLEIKPEVPYSTDYQTVVDQEQNSNVEDEMNIVFESYSDNLVTSPDEIDSWMEKL